MTKQYDAIIVGSGPNGLAAAITLAQAGRSVLVMEARDTIGGGMRSTELTLPGFLHDVCSAVHPLGLGSPFFRELPLERYGLEWIQPTASLAHPLDDGSAVMLYRSVEKTAQGLGEDGEAYLKLFKPLAEDWPNLSGSLLGPLRWPEHPLSLARFGLNAVRSAQGLSRQLFKGERARALFAGQSGHAVLPLDQSPSAAFALVLGLLAHAVGWPIPRGGSKSIAEALAAHLRSLGGEIITGQPVESLRSLPPTRATLLDVTPRQVLQMAGDRLPATYRRRLSRYRYGLGSFKLDYALSGPVPWRAGECAEAGTLHLGGTMEEIAASERSAAQGIPPERPYVLVVQPSLFDASRAPVGQHTLWAYCHVPNGSTFDMTDRIERQIERYAPGFRNLVLSRHVMFPADLHSYNQNYIGGDINGGIQDLGQLFTRPVISLSPYTTPAKDIFICSSSTPPGGGVHGMCGYFAAQAALHGVLK